MSDRRGQALKQSLYVLRRIRSMAARGKVDLSEIEEEAEEGVRLVEEARCSVFDHANPTVPTVVVERMGSVGWRVAVNPSAVERLAEALKTGWNRL